MHPLFSFQQPFTYTRGFEVVTPFLGFSEIRQMENNSFSEGLGRILQRDSLSTVIEFRSINGWPGQFVQTL